MELESDSSELNHSVDEVVYPLESVDVLRLPKEEQLERSAEFLRALLYRRSVRRFANREIADVVIENAVAAAARAPSGANRQPWLFVSVKTQEVKAAIRAEAERVELEFYKRKAPPVMLEALAPLKTNWNKPHLEEASHLIVVFSESHILGSGGALLPNYYVKESVCIAVGILISALSFAGVQTLSHTPNPAQFLNTLLGVPSNRKALMILACGYANEPALVPKIEKKDFAEIFWKR